MTSGIDAAGCGILNCPPEWLGEHPREILDAYLDEARYNHIDDDPITALLLVALKKKFPCGADL